MGNMLTKMATRSMTNMATNMAKTAATAAAVTAGTNMFAKAIGVDDTMFGKIMTAGVPAMVMAGGRDRGVADNLFGNSKKDKKDRKRPKDADEAEKGFFDVFGAAGNDITREVAAETGASEKQVGGVLGMMMPDFEEVIGEEGPADGGGLQGMFKAEAEDAKKQGPSMLKLATKLM